MTKEKRRKKNNGQFDYLIYLSILHFMKRQCFINKKNNLKASLINTKTLKYKIQNTFL